YNQVGTKLDEIGNHTFTQSVKREEKDHSTPMVFPLPPIIPSFQKHPPSVKTAGNRSIAACGGLGKHIRLVTPLVSGLPFVPLESVAAVTPLVSGLPFISLLSWRDARSDFLLELFQIQPDFPLFIHSCSPPFAIRLRPQAASKRK
ncbi:MAG: hypothetical protein ACRECJ_03155, partial [Limisphaerales bacterium]